MSNKTLDFNIPLTEKQVKIYNLLNQNKWKEVLFYGSSRSGKTFVILYWLIIQCVIYKANCLVLRAIFTSLVSGMIKQTLPAVLNAIAKHNGYDNYTKIIMSNGDELCKFNGKDNYLRFFNGAYIQFASLRGSADNDSQYDKILSTEWGHIFIDEVSEVDEQAVDVLRTRLAQKLPVRCKLLFALNPTRKSGWTYIRYFKNETRDGLKIPQKTIDSFLVVKFTLNDNRENISEDYEETLQAMSALQRKRFLEGDYFDESEGEIFKKINWTSDQEIIMPSEWTDICIYTDPSAKDSKTSDFKASVLLGKARNKVYLIDLRAVQGTSLQMLQNIKELYDMSPNKLITRVYMERKSMPLDFKIVFEQFQSDTGWLCPLEFDDRNMGDKFTMIESILEPMINNDRFFFFRELKDTNRGELAVNQFLFFSPTKSPSRKDDIPDACARGISLLNRGSSSIGTSFKDEPLLIKQRKTSFF